MSGLGAWSFGYYKFGFVPTNDRQKAGLRAVKQGLVDNGFSKNIVVDMEVYGNAVTARAKEFQKAHGLTSDGVVGPTSARFLWRHYIEAEETRHDIPEHFLGKIATLESANDPVAQGFSDDQDEGLFQWHMPYFAGETLAHAWNPAYVAPVTAERLVGAKGRVGSWLGAIAAHNCGEFYAKKWVQAGYPKSGLVDNNIDWYARASNYVGLVHGSAY